MKYLGDKKIVWDENKNKCLKETRSIDFESIKEKIKKLEILEIIPNKNYQNQKYLLLEIDDYIWTIPCIINEKEIILKTAFPSRKFNKLYKNDSKI